VSFELEPYRHSLTKFAEWAEKENLPLGRRWSDRLNSNDNAHIESAVSEAVAWDYLACHGVEISWHEDISTGGPDYCCTKDNTKFYVEITNLSTDAVIRATQLNPSPNSGPFLSPQERCSGATTFNNLTARIKQEISSKAGQCSRLQFPALVFVTLFHWQASVVCVDRHHIVQLLHSKPGLSGKFNPETGALEGELYPTTDMALSSFTKKYTTEPARRNISGILVGGFGLTPPDARVFGVLHPDPVRPFNPELLPHIPFCRFSTWPPVREVVVEWTDDDDV
jgi:hypothetical protein